MLSGLLLGFLALVGVEAASARTAVSRDGRQPVAALSIAPSPSAAAVLNSPVCTVLAIALMLWLGRRMSVGPRSGWAAPQRVGAVSGAAIAPGGQRLHISYRFGGLYGP